jgi:hypothetical protein
MSSGLSDEEYQFLLDDINQAVEEGNRKYGYGGLDYIDSDGNHYPPQHNDKPRKLRSRSKTYSYVVSRLVDEARS